MSTARHNRSRSRTVVFTKPPYCRLTYLEIEMLKLGVDQVYSGFAVAGSSSAQAFPVPSLRLFAQGGKSILFDRGSLRRLEELGRRVSGRINKQLVVDPVLRE